MLSITDVEQVLDGTAYDCDGHRLGGIETVYLDDLTGEPTFALVNTGLFGTKSSFVPLRDASLRDGDLHLAHSKDQVKDAPNVEVDEHLSPVAEAELYAYYGLDYHQGDVTTGDAGDDTRLRLRRHG